ncbi:hypothetical protein KQX54_019235 [Cotesia glomerata]|uniref:Ribosomal protein S4 n=1 Tax=Cotesia glomerata TaxID=32391 RepID=A0AAV7IY71_COTGL|nr:hypothetical protein KQX54_019235 [Cotesia glomerata]
MSALYFIQVTARLELGSPKARLRKEAKLKMKRDGELGIRRFIPSSHPLSLEARRGRKYVRVSRYRDEIRPLGSLLLRSPEIYADTFRWLDIYIGYRKIKKLWRKLLSIACHFSAPAVSYAKSITAIPGFRFAKVEPPIQIFKSCHDNPKLWVKKRQSPAHRRRHFQLNNTNPETNKPRPLPEISLAQPLTSSSGSSLDLWLQLQLQLQLSLPFSTLGLDHPKSRRRKGGSPPYLSDFRPPRLSSYGYNSITPSAPQIHRPGFKR